MNRRFALAFVALGLTAGATLAATAFALARSARPSQSPSAFAVHVVELIAANRYDDAWRSLHPLHQRFAPRGEYVSCESQSPIPGHLASVRVLRVFDDPAPLGFGRFVASKAVVVRITLAEASQRVVVDDTVHTIRLGNRWRWVLPTWRLAEYRAGICPDGIQA